MSDKLAITLLIIVGFLAILAVVFVVSPPFLIMLLGIGLCGLITTLSVLGVIKSKDWQKIWEEKKEKR